MSANAGEQAEGTGRPSARVSLGRLSRLYLSLCAVVGLVTPVVAVLTLYSPLATFRGDIFNGYISGFSYELTILGVRAHYPPLDSVNTISRVYLLLATLSTLTSLLGFWGVVKGLRVWLGLAAVAPLATAMLVSLLYSITRVTCLDIIPVIPSTLTAPAVGGRVYLEQPVIEYGWACSLAREPLIPLVVILVAVLLSIGALLTLARWATQARETGGQDGVVERG